MLIVFIYYLELFYYNSLLFNFRNKYDERLDLGAKERGFEHELRRKGSKI